MRSIQTVAVMLACLLPAMVLPTARADEAGDARAAFDSLYSSKIKEVSRTRSKADDVALAEHMLATAETASNTPLLLKILCERAHDLAAQDPSGYDTAAKALAMIAAAFPDQADATREKLIDLRQMQYARSRGDERVEAGNTLIDLLLAAGDAHIAGKKLDDGIAAYRRALIIARAIRSDKVKHVDALLERVAHRRRIMQRVDALESKLTGGTNDGAMVDEIVRLYVLELDDPAGAALIAPRAGDAALRKNIVLAAKPVDALQAAEAIALGQWYRAESGKATPNIKPALLNRARVYFERFLETHQDDDVQRVTANAHLKEVTAVMAKLGVQPYPIGGQPATVSADDKADGKVLDLLKATDPDKHAVSGKWVKRDDEIHKLSREGSAMLRIPVVPRGSYELAMEITHDDGGGHLLMIMPVKDTALHFFFSFQGYAVLASVDGAQAYQGNNPYRIENGELARGKKYKFKFTVKIKDDQGQITIERDGEPFLKWEGQLKSLAPNQSKVYVLPKPYTFAIGTHHAVAKLHAMQLRMLSGKAEPVK